MKKNIELLGIDPMLFAGVDDDNMKIIESIEEMQKYSIQLKCKGKTLANVSTTGFLHKGHMSLVDIAKENADEVVVNIDHIDPYKKFKQNPHKYYIVD